MTPGPGQFEISRVIAAPRARVFAAWTTPELLGRWFAPGEWAVTHARLDLRIGGGFEIGMRRRRETGCVQGSYLDVVADELLVFSWRWSGAPEETSRVTLRLRDHPDGTELTLTHALLSSETVAQAHRSGWHMTLTALGALLAQETAA